MVTGYVLEETVTELGIGKISISFAISNADGEPVPDKTTISGVSAENENVLDKVKLSIADGFLASVNLLGVYKDAKGKVTKVVDAIDTGLQNVEIAAGSIESVNNQIADLQSNIVALTNSPNDLANAISSIFNTMNGTIATVSATFDVFKGFFDFGDDDVSLSFNSVAIDAKNSNDFVLNNAMKANALSGAFLAAAQKDYGTVSEIDEDLEILNDQVEVIRSASEIDPEVLDAILDARELTSQFLEDLKLRTSKIILIETPLTGARALSYR